MSWEMILGGLIFIVIAVVSAKMGMNRSYTAGKHLFKMSDGNLDENNKEFSDQNYYDNKGILK